MSTRVMIPPDPLITPADVPGGHAPNDPTIAAMIAGCQRRIDGPSGWLGRCLGPQTLETVFSCWGQAGNPLYGPVIGIDSVIYIDSLSVEQVLSADIWTLDHDGVSFGASWTGPALASRRYPIKITYQAGYDGEDPFAGGTGDVPQEAKEAIIEAVQQLMLARADTLGLRSVETVDVETITYLDADKVSAIMRKASSDLLSGLWVPRL